MSEKATSRALARSAIKAGRIPLKRPGKVWGGPGNGNVCAVCSQTIGPERMDIAVKQDGAVNLHLDAECFNACEAEWWGTEHRSP